MPPIGTKLSGATILDISHECLIRKWRRLQDWLHEEVEAAAMYEHLLFSAKQWKRDGRLWPFAELDRALAWRELEEPNATWAERYGGEFDAVDSVGGPALSEAARERICRAVRQADTES